MEMAIVTPKTKPPYTSCRRIDPWCCKDARIHRHKRDRKRTRQIIRIALNKGKEERLV